MENEETKDARQTEAELKEISNELSDEQIEILKRLYRYIMGPTFGVTVVAR